MVDPNPGRGMPLQLQRYWLVGKGAAKIRWNTPGDFLRCVHNLRKYFPKDPKGLCNILHTKATGGPPGHGSAEKHLSMVEDAASLTAAAGLLAMQDLGDDLWAGPLAPINRPTGEPGRERIFEPDSLAHRPLPLPLRHRRVDMPGHQGAVTVGRILGLTIGPDEEGHDCVWGWGDWLSEDVVPEVREARYLVDKKITGASLDPGGRVTATVNPETGAEHMLEYTMGGATLVSIPAFTKTRIFNLVNGDWPDDDPDMDHTALGMEPAEEDCGCSDYSSDAQDQAFTTGATDPAATDHSFAVNSSGWHGLPLAPREAEFDNDDAVKRITAHASGGQDTKALNRAFLWRDQSKPETDPTSYRLPVGDIVNGKLTLVYHAIYAAAALLSGAHGGLPDIPDQEKAQLRNVISEIYPEMAKAFNDSSIMAPWDRPAATEAAKDAAASITLEEYAMADNPKEPYGDVKYADPGYQQDGKKRYPIDTADHVRAAWSYINQAKNAGEYNPKQLAQIKARIIAAAKKLGVSISDSTMAEDDEYSVHGYPLDPPRSWFEDPHLSAKTPLTVEPDGRVYGHLAAWGECHRDVGNRSCVLAPKSRKGYEPYHLGEVFTAEGDRLRVGKIVMDTRHAGINLGYTAAAIHYDNTGDEVAVVRAGEDAYGIWVAGALVPEATPAKAAKLRRSPLSGDWRAVDGNLELTAALAVNVPAFPVYAMDGEDRLALVAAGQVFPEKASEEDFSAEDQPVDDLQIDRMWELQAIWDEDFQYEQWQRARQFAAMVAEDGDTPPEVPAEDPIYGLQAQLTRQMDAQFSIVEGEDDGESADEPGSGAESEPKPDNGSAVVAVG